ncbi:MAG: hypothetical protein PVH61_06050 [Candidatus Aminicenantes bacterium]|jgi:hypothetical protein
MKLIKLLTLILYVVFAICLSASPRLRLAIQNTGGPIQWDTIGYFFENKNPPLLVVSLSFPFDAQTTSPGFPPQHIPVLLQLELPPEPETFSQKNLDNLSQLLMTHSNISHLSLRGWEQIDDFNHLAYVTKTIASLVRGIWPNVQIALACADRSGSRDLITITQTLATNPETSPYFDCFFLESPGQEEIRQKISRQAPQTFFWETVCTQYEHPSRILSCLLDNNPFTRPGTSMLVISTDKAEILYPSLLRFSDYLGQGLYRDATGINVTDTDGSSSRHPLFFRAADHMPILFLGGDGKEKVRVNLKKGLYKKAFVRNLTSGDEAVFKINRTSTALVLNLKEDFFAVHFIPRKQKIAKTRYNVNVTGRYRLSAEEIIARVRAWKARQKSHLRAFTATMTTSLRLRIGNLKETFDLTIKGPMFSERNKPYDWVWKEFFVNGVKWKSKRVPKIPLLQPEKVKIMPLDISLTEEYDYSLAGETTTAGQRIYIVDFQPRKELKSTSLYQGRIRVDARTFAVLREHLIQLNLKGEVLSNVETRYFKPISGSAPIWLPTSVTGHQVFSTAGRITNIERKVTLTDIVINPQDFQALKEQAHQSTFQMVRDTQKGLRYLIKDKKSGQRQVEWETKKSQLFGVLGGFYDSSIGYPIPLLGFNYMNFNLGGKGRQVNVLFGGVMLTANYSDPSFMGTKMDLGANLVAVAFPFKNRVYQRDTSTEIEGERLKRLPFRFQVNSGYPLGTYLKYSSIFFFEYNKFSLAKTTADEFVLPQNTLALGWRSRFTFNVKGFRLALWGEIARRLRWKSWGIPGSDHFNPDQQSYVRWRVVLDKDFFISPFRKIHLTASYFDGLRLDRFSAYKFGFFNELNLHGYMSGVVQATRAFLFNLSYGYSLGKAFRLELFYDSAWVTNPSNDYHNTYFSGAAISGTVNVPGLNGILRFEAGMPVVNNGIKGIFVYFVLLKMF